MSEKLILRTPLIPYGDEEFRERIFLKPENLQILGSYKIRGVMKAIDMADPERVRRGLITISAGNMAQTVAYLAMKKNIPCKVFIPITAPEIKKDAIKRLNAEIVELPFEEIWGMVKSNGLTSHGGLLIHPFFTPGMQEGYGEIGKEIIMDLPETSAVIIPFGVGGLTSGIAKAIKELRSDIDIYTCEPTTASPLHTSFRNKRPMHVDRKPSFIDAIGTPEVLPEVFMLIKDLVKESILVTPDEAQESLKKLLSLNKILCEGAAAASLAASLKVARRNDHEKVVCVLTGGNISSDILRFF